MVKLYGRKTSINVQKASWALGEAALEFEWIDKEGTFGSIDTPAYRALNPQGRVPLLDDGGTIVRQSYVIVRYVAQKFGAGTLWPEDAGARAAADYWMDWQAADNWRNLVTVFVGLVRTPPEERDAQAIAKSVAALGQDFEYLDDQLAGNKFVTGEAFTMGDIPVGAAAHRFFVLPIERPSVPNVEAWYERLQERPAFRECVMVPLP
ncbi:MAG: glutathione S-transferase N-terminal domain-containing protein [Alphaproteobacteria bacterium]|nr:glutathione S-transferase N-terminal domain-containing protein [Alphaproteobacteria bacterium]